MNIAILGAGNVGATLGKRFAEQGHTVSFGVPNPEKYAGSGLNGTIGTVAEVAPAAEIILLAIPYNAAEQAIKDCGDLRSKILIEATNPLGTRAPTRHSRPSHHSAAVRVPIRRSNTPWPRLHSMPT